MICEVCKRGGRHIVATDVGPLCPPCHTLRWIRLQLAVPPVSRTPVDVARRGLLQAAETGLLMLVGFDHAVKQQEARRE